MLKTGMGPDLQLKRGNEYEIDEKLAADLIKCNAAIELKKSSKAIKMSEQPKKGNQSDSEQKDEVIAGIKKQISFLNSTKDKKKIEALEKQLKHLKEK